MSRFQQSMKVAALFVLLFGVVCVPALLMEHHSGAVLNELSLRPVEMVHLDSGYSREPASQDLSIWDRIQRINLSRAQVQSTGTIYLSRSDGLIQTQVQPDGSVELNPSDVLLSPLEEQLKLLQTFGALPEFSLSETVTASFVQRVYMDPDHPELAVSVWVIHAKYQDLSLLAYMDADLSAIYDVYIEAKQGASLLNASKDRFLEYLNTFGADPGLTEEALSVNRFIDKDTGSASLSLTSTNMGARDYTGGDAQIKVYEYVKVYEHAN